MHSVLAFFLGLHVGMYCILGYQLSKSSVAHARCSCLHSVQAFVLGLHAGKCCILGYLLSKSLVAHTRCSFLHSVLAFLLGLHAGKHCILGYLLSKSLVCQYQVFIFALCSGLLLGPPCRQVLHPRLSGVKVIGLPIPGVHFCTLVLPSSCPPPVLASTAPSVTTLL